MSKWHQLLVFCNKNHAILLTLIKKTHSEYQQTTTAATITTTSTLLASVFDTQHDTNHWHHKINKLVHLQSAFLSIHLYDTGLQIYIWRLTRCDCGVDTTLSSHLQSAGPLWHQQSYEQHDEESNQTTDSDRFTELLQIVSIYHLCCRLPLYIIIWPEELTSIWTALCGYSNTNGNNTISILWGQTY